MTWLVFDTTSLSLTFSVFVTAFINCVCKLLFCSSIFTSKAYKIARVTRDPFTKAKHIFYA